MEKQSQNPMASGFLRRGRSATGTHLFYFRGICYNRDAVLAGRQPCLTAAQAGALYQKQRLSEHSDRFITGDTIHFVKE